VVTKSGTNEFHGSIFDFARNAAFNANTYFNKLNGFPRDNLKRQQYGATLGGPIKKNRAFFLGYQGRGPQSRERNQLRYIHRRRPSRCRLSRLANAELARHIGFTRQSTEIQRGRGRAIGR